MMDRENGLFLDDRDLPNYLHEEPNFTWKTIPLTFQEILDRLRSPDYTDVFTAAKRSHAEMMIGNIFIDVYEEKYESENDVEKL